MCQIHCGLPQRCLSASFVTSDARERQIMNILLFIIFNDFVTEEESKSGDWPSL